MELDWCRKSDEDGDPHIIINNPDLDCAGWRLEVRKDGSTYTSDFVRATVWSSGEATNFLGYGDARTAWVAYLDWGGQAMAVLRPDGTRHPLNGG